MVAISRSADFRQVLTLFEFLFPSSDHSNSLLSLPELTQRLLLLFPLPSKRRYFSFLSLSLVCFLRNVARHRIICCSCIPYFFSLRHDMADHALYTVPNSPLEPMYHALLEKKKNLLSFHTVCIMPTESNF